MFREESEDAGIFPYFSGDHGEKNVRDILERSAVSGVEALAEDNKFSPFVFSAFNLDHYNDFLP